ncbi:MAG: hypothetical protein ACU0BB_03530 [Paracoccaceae bacterium]
MDEIEHQKRLLAMQVGLPGSGAARYGAAMYFFQIDMMTTEMLEIYRCCSKFDREDPIDLAHYKGVPVPQLSQQLSEPTTK